MTHITETREAFFARHRAAPCKHCLTRNTPGEGVGPLYGQILLELYADRETERLQRLLDLATKASGTSATQANFSQRIQPDGWDETLRARNHELYIRACWLLDMIPDAHVLAGTKPSAPRNPAIARNGSTNAHPQAANAEADNGEQAA